MNILGFIMMVIDIGLVLLTVSLIISFGIKSRRYTIKKVLTGVDYFYLKYKVWFYLLAVYSVVSLVVGILNLTGIVDIIYRENFLVGITMGMLLFYQSATMSVCYGEKGIIIGSKFFEWGKIKAVEILADEKRYPEYETVRITIKSEDLSVKGGMVSSEVSKVQDYILSMTK